MLFPKYGRGRDSFLGGMLPVVGDRPYLLIGLKKATRIQPLSSVALPVWGVD